MLLCLAGIALLLACADDKKTSEQTRVVESLLGDTIVFPASGELVINGQVRNYNNYPCQGRQLRLFSYINGNCSSCVGTMQGLDSLAGVFSQITPTIPCFYVYYEDKKGFIYNFDASGILDLPVYLDGQKEVLKTNNFPDNPLYHTLLLDSTGAVLAVGNPLHTLKLKK